jgi:hypothetical protein
MAVLLCAAGVDITETYRPSPCNGVMINDFYNGVSYATGDNWNYIVTLHLVRAMNDPASCINKAALRAAYKYYNEALAGFEPSNNGISTDCVMLIATLIGNTDDISPFNYLKDQYNFNTKFTASGVTPLMVAIVCGHYDMVQYMVGRHADINAKTDFSTGISSHIMFAAFINKHWKIAQYLQIHGTITSDVQKKEIIAGITALQLGKVSYTNWYNKNKFVNKPQTSKLINTLNDGLSRLEVVKISLGLQLPNDPLIAEDTQKIIKQCRLFIKLLRPFITADTAELYTEAQKCVDKNDIKGIATEFNMLDAMLRQNPEYNLGSKIDIMLMQIK